jgi:hypothetical protein
VKLPLIDRNGSGCEIAGCEINSMLRQERELGAGSFICPHGGVGERIWVKETFRTIYDPGTCLPGALDIDYRADGKERIGDRVGKLPWKPSIFMPRWASRITMTLTAVRAEPVRDISSADARSEGIAEHAWKDPRAEYRRLWESINGALSWIKNPWVWVLEFKKL